MAIRSSTEVNVTPARTVRTLHWQHLLERSVLYFLLLVCVVITGAPFAYMVTGSF
jgi:hypothetical protein